MEPMTTLNKENKFLVVDCRTVPKILYDIFTDDNEIFHLRSKKIHQDNPYFEQSSNVRFDLNGLEKFAEWILANVETIKNKQNQS